MNVNDRIDRTVERVLAVWAVGVAASAIWVLMFVSPWWLLAVAGFGIATYYASLFMTGFYLAWKVSAEEMEAAIAAKQPQPQPEEPASETFYGQVTDVKGPVIGRYMDKDIYQWIEVMTPGGLKRFDFLNGAVRDRGGNPMLPNEDGFAFFDECIYGLQPELIAEKTAPSAESV